MNIEQVNLTKENLMKIKLIDDTFYNPDEIEWYTKRYNQNHKAILLSDSNECAGYLLSVPIKKELFNAIINGVITDDLYINPDMIVSKSKYNYLVSFIVLEKYRNRGYAKEMMKKFIANNKGIYCALAVSEGGKAVVSKYMKLVKILNEKVSVFKVKL